MAGLGDEPRMSLVKAAKDLAINAGLAANAKPMEADRKPLLRHQTG
jgi:hypothetical protein